MLLSMGENADEHLRLLALHTTRRSVRTRLLEALPASIWSPGKFQSNFKALTGHHSYGHSQRSTKRLHLQKS